MLCRVGVLKHEKQCAERQAAAQEAVEVGEPRRQQRLAVETWARADIYRCSIQGLKARKGAHGKGPLGGEDSDRWQGEVIRGVDDS